MAPPLSATQKRNGTKQHPSNSNHHHHRRRPKQQQHHAALRAHHGPDPPGLPDATSTAVVVVTPTGDTAPGQTSSNPAPLQSSGTADGAKSVAFAGLAYVVMAAAFAI
ncbi:hypothetical protein PG997_001321 [Apiospora hydei]|uniref:Uncharacterized protein n=1 Tax=Apiospora hydei TaxID=1337664 RepID=A0ABR1XDC2_9PEZI